MKKLKAIFIRSRIFLL